MRARLDITAWDTSRKRCARWQLMPRPSSLRQNESPCRTTSGLRYALDANRWATILPLRRVCSRIAIAPCSKTFWDGSITSDEYLVSDSDRDSYRAWLRQFLAPAMKDRGMGAEAGESDEQKALRARLFQRARVRCTRSGGFGARHARLPSRRSPIRRQSITNWPAGRFRWPRSMATRSSTTR